MDELDLFSFSTPSPGNGDDPSSRMAELTSQLHHHNQLYYQDAAPEISDAEYDALYRELENLEKSHPHLADPNSPTQRVGGAPLEIFQSIEHLVPMLSIDDVFELSDDQLSSLPADTPRESELIAFYKRLQKNLGQTNIPVTIEPKLDGVAISLVYRDGNLAYAATRGDGKRGDLITENARTIHCIPLKLNAQQETRIDLTSILPYLTKNNNGQSEHKTNPTRPEISLQNWLENDDKRGDGTNVQERLRQEAQSILAWANQTNHLIEPKAFAQLMSAFPVLGGQSEHFVIYLEEFNRVLKITIPPYFGAQNAHQYTRNILSSNYLFGDDIQLHGVLNTDIGPALVTSQPYVHGIAPDIHEVQQWFTDQGFISNGYNSWIDPQSSLTIADAHVGNLIKSADGALIPIDLQIIHLGTINLPEMSLPSLLEVRGEVFMPNSAFAKMNEERDEAGLSTFANPRNATAGTLKLLNSSEVAKRPLAFLAHGIGAYDGPEIHTEHALHDLLDQLNFPRNQPIWHADSLEGVLAAVAELNEQRHSFDYATDGAVIKILDHTDRASLGFTSRAPRWAAAYKFLPEQAVTILKDITIQVGRTGVLTPVAELEPVLVSGSTVSRATLHNQDEIDRKGIHIGDTVIIEKAGEIIPAVVKVITEKRPAHATPYSLYDAVSGQCPSCHGPISKEESMVAWRCTNFDCPAQAVTGIQQFASRKALYIDGLGSSVAEALVRDGLVKSPLDLFKIDLITLAELNLGTKFEPRLFGEKRAAKVLDSLEIAKSKPLHLWLYAMGIRNIGESAAMEISRLHQNLAEIPSSPIIHALANLPNYEPLSPSKRKKENHPLLAEFCIDDSFGPVAAASILNFFASEAGQNVIRKLDQENIHPISNNYAPRPAERDTSQLPLLGKTFVITGTLSKPRPDFKKQIESLGGKVASAVSSQTDYLLAGEKAGSKADKAESLGVTILDEDAYLRLIAS